MATSVASGAAGTVITRSIVKHASLLSKFKGALVGAVVGDCLGAHFEWKESIDVEEVVKFFNLSPSVKGESYEQETFTDDTAMARSVASSLIEHKGFNAKDMAKRFTEEFHREDWRGYGGNVGHVFGKLLEEKYEDPFGPGSQQFSGQGSYGNGGAMRIVPAALFGYNYKQEDLNDLVGNVTKITHTHKDAIAGAQMQCAAVQLALQAERSPDLDTNEFISQLHDWMIKIEKDDESLDSPKPKRRAKEKSEMQPKPYCYKLKMIQEFLKNKDTPRTDIQDMLGTDVSALGSVPTAVYAFTRCFTPVSDVETDHPLERTIIYAVTLGGDTDTIATMAGAIAGAYYGIEKIPQTWQDRCEGVADAISQAEQLYKLIQCSEGDNADKT